VPPALATMPAGYTAVLADIKQRILVAQSRAALAVNRELVALYWHVGRTIVERQTQFGWGESVVERLAHDLRHALPKLAGFSPRNVWRMRAFFIAWSTPARRLPQPVAEVARRGAAQKLPQAVAEIPWGHNILLLEKLGRAEDRLWYADRAKEHGWSRATLQAQIAKRTHIRQGKATTNFVRTLPSPQSDLAQQTLKDPYTFDFLTVGSEAHERVTENDLVAHVREFLLELGVGFAFIGSQVKLTVGEVDYFLDLLFYHVQLRCHVVVELKATAFRPEHAGKMNFYLSAVDDLLKHPDDQPSIGLLLCRSRDRMQVEYALRDVGKPIGVAEWETKMVERLPESLRGSLPTVEELEAELGPRGKGR
jgi:predicted nuclease of restriction endonuclease-like (RecB) superfamily